MLSDAERALLRQYEVEMLERSDKALNVVHKLCQREREWLMSVPARPDYDPDIVIANSLKDVPELLRRLAAARAGERWIPVTERLPEENTPVEVHGMKRLDRAIAQRRGDEWLIETCSDLINIYPPKHWCPLPSPPAESETK